MEVSSFLFGDGVPGEVLVSARRSLALTAVALFVVLSVGVATVSCQRDQTDLSESSEAVGSRPAHETQTAQETETPSEPTRITVEQVKQWMADGVPFVVLDSRSEGAWEADDTIAVGAIRMPPNDVASHLSEIPRGAKIVAYCT
jgi:hypothetical protein